MQIPLGSALPLAKLLPFEGRPLRTLYTEGFCGGAVIPLGDPERPANDVHVPLAHQSALAGVLLAAAAVGHLTDHTAIRDLQLPTGQLPARVVAPLKQKSAGRGYPRPALCADGLRWAYALSWAGTS